ncbi:nucleoside diphosphate-linked moiety X motif 8 [Thrips palmi]|uniref:Nucleoside diphosphate-linked moiety X motif 8 n=1 Tax=Thrips palmi TaxID=161013 RepID=A0A6P8ZGJ2_THRPL|nr:nucleoside diphosphate-linked moiety X motif 8 [Thrips palmi]
MLPCSLLRSAPRCPLACIGVLAQQQAQQVRTPSAVDFSNSSSGASTASYDAFAPDNVLSKQSREDCVRRLSLIPCPSTLAANPKASAPDNDTSPPAQAAAQAAAAKAKEAAVLVPLCVVDGEVCLLFTLRSPHMSSHRNQVSFPGGMKDEEDDSFESTALRETEEELGLPRGQVEVWGRCPTIESINRVNAVPVVGNLGHIKLNQLKFNQKEVGDVFTIPLRHLCDSSNFRYTQFRTGKGYVLPVFLGAKYKVWGLTARITHMFLSTLLPSVYRSKLYYIKPLKV